MNKTNKQVMITALLLIVLAVIFYVLYVMNYRPTGFVYKDF